MPSENRYKPRPIKPSDVWVEDLRNQLVLPTRDKPITRAACDRLINKWMDGRIKEDNAKGQSAKSYVPKEVADAVKEYFKRRHNL